MKTFKLIILASILTALLLECGFSAPYRALATVYGDEPRGQWIMGFGDLSPSLLTAEFYDNVGQDEAAGPGWGSGPNGYQSINGFVREIFYDTFGNIASFSVTATVLNDRYTYESLLDGTASQNDLGQLADNIQGQNKRPMYGTRLTADFADAGILPFPSSSIRAVNYDVLAWRGRSESEPPLANDVFGSYSIPVWNFGDIEAGAWATRDLQFALYRHEAPGSALYNLLLSSQMERKDILSNRTVSLKANSRPAPLFVDDGTAIPGPNTANGGNASVYFDDRLGILLRYPAGPPSDQTWFPAMKSNPTMLPFVLEMMTPDACLQSITFKASGTGDDCADIEAIQIWLDCDANGVYSSEDMYAGGFRFPEDNGEVTLSADSLCYNFPPDSGSSIVPSLIVTYTMSPCVSTGKTYKIDITGVTASTQDGTALDSVGIPLEGSILSTEQNPPHIQVSLTDQPPMDHSWWNDLGAIDTEMLQVKLDANSANDIVIDSLDLIGSNTPSSESDVDKLKVFVDENSDGKIDVNDTLLGEADNAAECSISPAGGYVLPAGSRKNLLLAYKMKPGNTSSQVRVYTCGIMRINAHVVGSTDTLLVFGLEVMSPRLYAFSQLPTIAASDNQYHPIQDHDWWESVSNENCTVAQLELCNTISDNYVTIDHITVKSSGTGNDATDIEEVDLWLDQDLNGTITRNDMLIASGRYAADDDTITFDTDIYMAPDAYNWLVVVYKMRSGISRGATFHADITDVQGHTSWTNAPIVCTGLPVRGVTVTMVDNPPSLTITKGENSPMGRVWWQALGAQPQELLQFHVRSDADRDIWISDFRLKLWGYQMYYSDFSSISVFRDANSNGIIDSGDTEVCSTSSILYGPEFGFGPSSWDRAVIKARSSADYIIALSPNLDYAGGHWGSCYNFTFTGIDAHWTDDSEVAPYYGLPLESCKLSINGEPTTQKIGEAKLSCYDQWVKFPSVEVTSEAYSGYFIQESDKSAGIAVTSAAKVKRGDRISIIGKYVYNYSLSPFLQEAEVRVIERGRTITPLSMPNKATGGGERGAERAVTNSFSPDEGVILATGLNNLGLLIRTTGRVTGKYNSNTFYIDDGSGLLDGYADTNGNPLSGLGVSCSSESMVPATGSYVAVTGIMTQQYGARRLVPRDANDIVILKSAD